MSPSYRSPVVIVPAGSNMRIAPPGDEGLCSVPLGTTKISPGVQGDGALAAVLPQRDADLAVEDQEELVGVLVHVPDVLAPDMRDPDVVVVDPADDPRAVHVAEAGQRLAEVHGSICHTVILPRAVRTPGI
jgi:hypothetical protein